MQSSAPSVDATNANIVTQTQPIGSTVKENTNGLAAAVARALARGAAVYFSRPVRLFRPTKGMIIDTFVPNYLFLIYMDIPFASQWMDIPPRGCTSRWRLFDAKIYRQPYKERGGTSDPLFPLDV